MIKFTEERKWLVSVTRMELTGKGIHLGTLHVTDGWTADLCCEGFTSDELRQIADKLSELNGHLRRQTRRDDPQIETWPIPIEPPTTWVFYYLGVICSVAARLASVGDEIVNHGPGEGRADEWKVTRAGALKWLDEVKALINKRKP